MVNWFAGETATAKSFAGLADAACGILWAQAAKPAILKMDQLSRLKVLIGIGAILVLGLIMIYFALMAGRLIRKYSQGESGGGDDRAIWGKPGLGGKRGKSSRPPFEPDDWARKPLVASEFSGVRDDDSGEHGAPNPQNGRGPEGDEPKRDDRDQDGQHHGEDEQETSPLHRATLIE